MYYGRGLHFLWALAKRENIQLRGLKMRWTPKKENKQNKQIGFCIVVLFFRLLSLISFHKFGLWTCLGSASPSNCRVRDCFCFYSSYIYWRKKNDKKKRNSDSVSIVTAALWEFALEWLEHWRGLKGRRNQAKHKQTQQTASFCRIQVYTCRILTRALF